MCGGDRGKFPGQGPQTAVGQAVKTLGFVGMWSLPQLSSAVAVAEVAVHNM